MKTQKLLVKIEDLKRGNNSSYGNTSWYVYFTPLAVAKLGNISFSGQYVAKTASNAQCGYLLCNVYIGKTVEITYHSTKKGNMIITSIEEKGVKHD